METVTTARYVTGATTDHPDRHHHDLPDGSRLTHTHLDGRRPHGPDHRWTFQQVYDLGNDPDVAFDATATFQLTTVPIPTARVCTLQSYRDEHDHGSVDRIEDMIDLYRAHGPDALPPVVARADGHIEDGAHRLAAAVELGWTTIPAFVHQPDR